MKAAGRSRAELSDLLGSRRVDHVVVLGANGAMGYGSGALFTSAVPRVTFLARGKDKAEAGLKVAVSSVRSSTVADRVDTGDYDKDFDAAVSKADIIFEALTEDFELKRRMFERVDKIRRPDSIVATVTSRLSINALAEGRANRSGSTSSGSTSSTHRTSSSAPSSSRARTPTRSSSSSSTRTPRRCSAA